ncbi:hypothetical protein HPB48_005699 [Haemaphysalis longicornis]|uniref:Uncharacterized protein n=1 Tax=Haemaphysalis longicornis TaxID=44386 RepID=A0A9J6H0T6_HAELO|nr:hypothetical protein HPB48_005699 [Haemaphysalis longicornis]
MALQVRPMEPYISNASRCYIEEHEQAAAYRIEDMQGAFLTLALGLMLAVGVFAIELAANRARPREIRNRIRSKADISPLNSILTFLNHRSSGYRGHYFFCLSVLGSVVPPLRSQKLSI